LGPTVTQWCLQLSLMVSSLGLPTSKPSSVCVSTRMITRGVFSKPIVNQSWNGFTSLKSIEVLSKFYGIFFTKEIMDLRSDFVTVVVLGRGGGHLPSKRLMKFIVSSLRCGIETWVSSFSPGHQFLQLAFSLSPGLEHFYFSTSI
jgi:hypothetical protein